MKDRSKIGILLVNIGSPDAPTAKAVRPYLREFLSDARVIDYPRWLWLPLLYGVILTVRPKRSARLYQNIWREDGSPLLAIMRGQAQGLTRTLRATGLDVVVEVGLRYGNPSVGDALRRLRAQKITQLLVLPLYPQYSTTTTATSFDAVFDELKTWTTIPELSTITDYHAHPAYIDALANSIRTYWQTHRRPSITLFSYHGIPARYAKNGDPYPEQCQHTSELLAEALSLEKDEWAMSYQSRFGPEPWLQPYTDETLESWGHEKKKDVQVLCPGFSADCLETIDEIDREAREEFEDAGGEGFAYIPALNDSDNHIQALTTIILEKIGGQQFSSSRKEEQQLA